MVHERKSHVIVQCSLSLWPTLSLLLVLIMPDDSLSIGSSSSLLELSQSTGGSCVSSKSGDHPVWDYSPMTKLPIHLVVCVPRQKQEIHLVNMLLKVGIIVLWLRRVKPQTISTKCSICQIRQQVQANYMEIGHLHWCLQYSEQHSTK